MAKRITIQLIGTESDKEDVRLNDFIAELTSIKKALRETEVAISGAAEPTLDYKVVDLRHSSPSTVVLEPVPIEENIQPYPKLRERVIGEFTGELRSIKREKKLLVPPDMGRLSAYQDIGARPNSLITKVKIGAGRCLVTIDKVFKRNLDEIIGPDEFAEGAISGMLEAVNLHNTNRFTLYPNLGPRKLSGTFPPSLRPDIKKAIGGFVTVFGKLRYKAWSPYPHGVTAEAVDIHEPDSELPTLSQMRGAFAGITDNLNSAEFMDRLRHEDW